MPCARGTRAQVDAARAQDRRIPPGFLAPHDRMEALRPFVDEFWTLVLGTSYLTSFVSNESRFSSWEHYVGGREALIAKVKDVYDVDIASIYDEPIPVILRRVISLSNRR